MGRHRCQHHQRRRDRLAGLIVAVHGQGWWEHETVVGDGGDRLAEHTPAAQHTTYQDRAEDQEHRCWFSQGTHHLRYLLDRLHKPDTHAQHEDAPEKKRREYASAHENSRMMGHDPYTNVVR